MTKHIICVGNPADGFTFIGPFDHFEEAEKYASRVITGGYSIPELEDPVEQEHNTKT